MIGLDTNIVVRYLTHDDPAQTAAAVRVMDSLSSDSPGFFSLIVIAELVWVLEVSYRLKKNEIEQILGPYCEAKNWLSSERKSSRGRCGSSAPAVPILPTA